MLMNLLLKTLLALLILCSVLVAFLLLFDLFVQFRDTDEELAGFFRKKNIPATIGYYTSHGRKLRYLTVGKPSAPVTLLFLHGSPSSLGYFKKYFTDESLLSSTYMLAVDRPGYGYSGLGKPETSMQLQAEMIKPLVDRYHQQGHPLIIVGVSYGTSIGCRFTMDYPELVDGVVLVAPSLAPGEEKIYSIAYPMEWPYLKWMVPRMLVSANAEKLSHKEQLEKMVPLWKNIRSPVYYLQGTEDRLIYPSNALFAKQMLVNARKLDIEMIPGRKHLIMFSEIKRIKQAIASMILQATAYHKERK